MKKCMYCAEDIQDEAIKCKHCGEMLDKREVKTTDTVRSIGEETLLKCSPSLWGYSGWILFGIILTFAYGIGLLLILYAYSDRRNTIYTITNKRVITERGIISKNKEEISLADIRAINIKQDLSQRMFDYGDILIGTSATAGYEIAIKNIPHPKEAKEMVSRLKLAKE